MEWKDAIDDTLRSTRATLQRLHERHANYELAKRRAQDALYEPVPSPTLPSPSPPLSSPGLSSVHQAHPRRSATLSRVYDRPYARHATLAGHDGLLPPPLPRSTHWGSYADDDGAATARRCHYDAAELSRSSDTANALRLLRSQVRNLTSELELERTVRADGVREAKHYAGQQVDGLRGVVEQLREENAELRRALHAISSVTAPTAHDGDVAVTSAAVPDATRSTLPLTQRVEQLEERLERHQHSTAARMHRMDTTVDELVRAAVGREVERVRSIAREAAQTAVDDVVRQSIAKFETGTEAERRRVWDAVEHVKDAVQRQLRECALDDDARSRRLDDVARELRERLDTHRHETTAQLVQELETRCHPLRQDLVTLRRVVEEGRAGLDAALETAVMTQLRVVRPQWQDELRAWVVTQTQPIVDAACTHTADTVQGWCEAQLATQRQWCEEQLAEQQSTTTACVQAALERDAEQQQRGLRQDVDEVQGRVRECLGLVEETQRSTNELMQLVQDHAAAQHARHDKLDAQLAGVREAQERLSHIATAHATLAERVTDVVGRVTKVEAATARLREDAQAWQTAIDARVEARCGACEESTARATRERAECVTQECQERIAAVVARVAQHETATAQQLSQLHTRCQRDVEAGVEGALHAVREVEHAVQLQSGVVARLEEELRRARTDATFVRAADVHRLLQEHTAATESQLAVVETRVERTEQSVRDGATRAMAGLDALRTRLEQTTAQLPDKLEQLERRAEQGVTQMQTCESAMHDLTRRVEVLDQAQQRTRQVCAELEQRHEDGVAALETRLQRACATWTAGLTSLKAQCSAQGMVDALTADATCCELLMQALQVYVTPSRATLDAQVQQRRALAEVQAELRALAQEHTAVAERVRGEAETAVRTWAERHVDALIAAHTQARVEPTQDALRRRVEALEACVHRDGAVAPDDACAALTSRVRAVETTQADGLAVTADALSALRDSLLQCVYRVNCGLEACEESAPRVHTLEDVFVLLLQRLHVLHQTMQSLQQNAVATLELVQQQEVDLVVVAPLQQTVLRLARDLAAVAMAVGIDIPDLEFQIGELVRQTATSPTRSCSEGGTRQQ